jgi:hypothetical protein
MQPESIIAAANSVTAEKIFLFMTLLLSLFW